ncbi:MAG: hypothetical protein ACE5JK_00405 [Candidatus Omnitrophota bacterium]
MNRKLGYIIALLILLVISTMNFISDFLSSYLGSDIIYGILSIGSPILFAIILLIIRNSFFEKAIASFMAPIFIVAYSILLEGVMNSFSAYKDFSTNFYSTFRHGEPISGWMLLFFLIGFFALGFVLLIIGLAGKIIRIVSSKRKINSSK